VTNPSFETGTTGWTPENGSNTSVITQVSGGTYGAKTLHVVQTGTGGGGNTDIGISTNTTNGTKYGLSFWARSISGNTALRSELWGSLDNVNVTLTTSWQKFSGTITAGMNTASLYFWLANTGTYEIDAVQLEPSNNPTPYCDGSLRGAGSYKWNGTANASTSTCIYGQDGEINGATWTQNGKFGKALSFSNPSGAVVNLGNPASLNGLTSAGTISVWVHPANTTTGGILDRSTLGSGWAGPFYLWWQVSGFRFSVANNSGSTNIGSPTYSPNSWYHVVGTFDGSNVKMYVNGINVASAVQTVTPIDRPADSWLIGAMNSQGTLFPFPGKIDEVKIYNYALTADEIAVEYNAGKAVIWGGVSDTSQLNGGSVASTSASAAYCVPGASDTCSAPVAEWNFDEGQGTTVADSSGNGNTGTWAGTGSHWTNGKVNKAGKFNGTNDYVSAGNTGIAQNGPATAEGWFKFNVLATTKGSINGLFSPLYQHQANNYLYVQGTNDYFDTASAIQPNIWYHIALSYSGDTSTAVAYINGIKQNITLQAGAENIPALSAFMIGNVGGNYFSGSIDGVKVFNYVRTPAQVAWDYNQGKPVAQYNFDECSGTAIHDASGNGNTGTLTNATPGDCATNANTAWYNGRNGKYNASLNFDGVDDYIITPSFGFDPNVMTFAAWIRPDNLTGRFTLFGQSNGTMSIEVGTGNAAAPKIGIVATIVPGIWETETVNNAVSTGAWYQITVVKNGGGTTPSIYVNGVLQSLVTNNPQAYNTSATAKFIGARAPSQYFSGQIDDARIYNYALTAKQVQLLYNQSAAVRFGPVTGSP
jgi:hypothetical protein